MCFAVLNETGPALNSSFCAVRFSDFFVESVNSPVKHNCLKYMLQNSASSWLQPLMTLINNLVAHRRSVLCKTF